jgi:hypothetical protein
MIDTSATSQNWWEKQKKKKNPLINTLCDNKEGGGLEPGVWTPKIIDGFYISIFMIFKTQKHEPKWNLSSKEEIQFIF